MIGADISDLYFRGDFWLQLLSTSANHVMTDRSSPLQTIVAIDNIRVNRRPAWVASTSMGSPEMCITISAIFCSAFTTQFHQAMRFRPPLGITWILYAKRWKSFVVLLALHFTVNVYRKTTFPHDGCQDQYFFSEIWGCQQLHRQQ